MYPCAWWILTASIPTLTASRAAHLGFRARLQDLHHGGHSGDALGYPVMVIVTMPGNIGVDLAAPIVGKGRHDSVENDDWALRSIWKRPSTCDFSAPSCPRRNRCLWSLSRPAHRRFPRTWPPGSAPTPLSRRAADPVHRGRYGPQVRKSLRGPTLAEPWGRPRCTNERDCQRRRRWSWGVHPIYVLV